MRYLLLSLVATLTACAANTPDGDISPRGDTEEPAYCTKLPDDPDDPCSYLCDRAGLNQFVDKGECISLSCELSDGTQMRTGYCR
jgi:hypothetical protein